MSQEEMDVVAALHKNGVSRSAAVLAVALTTRLGARPERELLDIVAQYPDLDQKQAAATALHELRGLRWVETVAGGLESQVGDLRKQIASKIGDATVEDKLHRLRTAYDQTVRIVGPMSDAAAYTEYLDLIRGAARSIDLPMVATTSALSSVPLLQEQARKGVIVRILLASPRVAALLRGAPMRAIAKRRAEEWVGHCNGIPTMSVRISDNVDDMALATCMCVDETVLRLDIYDHERQQSLQGVMVEARAPKGHKLNLIRLFQVSFNDAWQRGQTPGFIGLLAAKIRPWWRILAGVFFTILAAATDSQAAMGILGSIAATFFAEVLGAWLLRRLST